MKARYFRLSFTPHQPSWWSQLPSSPGIYIFENKDKAPLYIGKSINLRSRIKQHLEASKDSFQKQSSFVTKTHFLRLRTTISDLEAIILESYLIKSIAPLYNSAQKDDKSDVYLVIENEPLSKIKLLRSTDLNLSAFHDPKTQVYGPYQNTQIAKELQKHLRRIFGYCQNPFNPAQRACFYYHLHQCPGACTGAIDQKTYRHHLTAIRRFLSGKFVTLKKELTKDISHAAKIQDFETADKLKTTLIHLEAALFRPDLAGFFEFKEANTNALAELVNLLGHPLLITPPHRIECFDIAHLQKSSMVGGMSVFIEGQPSIDQYRHFIVNNINTGDPGALKEILVRRFNHPKWGTPDLLVLDGGVAQLSIVSPVIPEQIPVIALSKKRETVHFFDHGHLVNQNLPLHKSSQKLLQAIRDEAHRFTTTFHQKKQRELLY